MPAMPSQRPFFLSTVFAAFRQPSLAAQTNPTTPSTTTASVQPNKQTNPSSYSTAAAAARNASSTPSNTNTSTQQQQQQPQPPSASGGMHSPRAAATNSIPIPNPGRRRGSDSSTEGFRNVRGADKWYVGGRTATGEERFFKLGVIRRVRSGDRLSLDRLSL